MFLRVLSRRLCWNGSPLLNATSRRTTASSTSSSPLIVTGPKTADGPESTR